MNEPITRPVSSSVLGPIAEFFARSTFRRPTVPIYSCAAHLRMPDDPEAIRHLAIAQWTQTVAFRETIETMHADGLRLFIDVGARGNLAGFVEDILRQTGLRDRGKPPATRRTYPVESPRGIDVRPRAPLSTPTISTPDADPAPSIGTRLNNPPGQWSN